ncbi:MAG: hypothetical protein Kow00105_18330 [Phycisphaeraceae bacterium]
MRITRRQFNQVVGTSIALTVLGCSDDVKDGSGRGKRGKLVLPDHPFTIGSPEKYRKPGVYQDFRQSHGVWIVSDGKQLVVLSAVCTHNRCGTRYDSMSQLFKCPCHESMFTTEGLNISGGKAKRPLERLGISLVASDDDQTRVLQVDPIKRYRQDDDNPLSGRNWSSPNCVYLFG